MALFRRGSGTRADSSTTSGRSFARWGTALPVPRVDPDFGDPGLAGLRAAAEAADWTALREQLSGVTDGQDLTWLVAAVTETAGMEEWLPRTVEAEPDSALPLLVSGARQIAWAWEARTRASARHVSREQFEVFHQRLRVAEEQLYEVAEREPEWVAPWYFLQIAGRGLQVGEEVARSRFDASVRRHPGHLGAHRQHLQQVCRKWSGSHEQMHDFARTSMMSAPPGGPLGELVAIAHLEQWLDLDSGEDSRYIRGQAVIDSLNEAADRSIRHPDYRRPRGWIGGFNTFAMAFSLAGQKYAAAELFGVIGTTVTQFPWGYCNGADPAEAFRTWRSAAGL